MKISNLREMTNEEITQKLHDSKEELFNLRFQQSMNRLENANKLKDVKIILITAYGDHRTEKKIMDMGAYAYFTKPFSNCDLLNTINHANEERFVEAQ